MVTIRQRMSREIGLDCHVAIQRGELSKSAHLVTHPLDRGNHP